jgi:stage IV sporulation protein FB
LGWSLPLGRIAGTAIRLHLTFLLFLLWLAAIGYAQAGPAGAAGSVSFIVLLFLCVTLHEFGHILAARHFGVHTPEILLLPIGGVSKLERIPEEPRQELIIALAGPAVTLVIAVALVLALGGLPRPESALRTITPHAILAQLAYANITLFVFNLLPAFPLDGGRVLRAILARFTGHLRATRLAAAIGRGAALILGLIALFGGNFILLLIAVFVFIAAGSEAGMAQMRGILFNVPARELMISEFRSLAPDARVSDAADALIRTSQTEFPIVDASGKLLGLLDRNGIIKALAERGPDARATETMRTDVPSVSERQRLHDGLELLQGGAPAIGVTGDEGQLVGLITMENLLEKVMIVRASERRGGQKPEVSVPHARA